MNRWIPLFLLLAAACKSPSPENSPASFAPELDSLFNFYEQQNLHFVNAEVRKGGELIYRQSAGYENLETQKELDSNSVFLIGSITKTYTAVMIMQLAEEGKIKLSDKLSQFFPEIPNAAKIDIEMLLRHRSGLFNYTSAEDFLSEVSQPISRAELLERFARLDTVFSPNARYEYSNTNYMLLGFIIEDLTSDQYENQLKKRILDKLNLESTYYGRPADLSHFARSYQYQDGNWLATKPAWNTDWARGAGAIAATLSDVSDFYEGLFAGQLVSEESLEQMIDLKEGYGLGIGSFPYGQKTFYGHGGGIESYRSVCGYNPKDSILFAQVSNASSNGNPNEISVQVLNGVYGNEIVYPDTAKKIPVAVPVSTLTTYEGNYSAPGFPLDIRIFVKDSLLYGQATGQPEFPLTAFSPTEFEHAGAGISMEFFKQDDVHKFHFQQGSNKLDFSRKP